MKRQMTPKERILASIDHQVVDKLPTDYWGVPEITQKLLDELHVSNIIEFAEKLDMDMIIHIEPELIVPRNGVWDIKMKRIPIPGGYGHYDEPEYFPIGDYTTIEEIEANYQFPTVEMFDYSSIARQCESFGDYYAIEAGYISLTYFYEMIRGTEQMMVDMIAQPEIARYIFDRLQEFSYQHVKNILEAGQGKIAISEVTDDFGSQNSLLFSPQMIDEYLSEAYVKNIELIKSYGSKVFHHDDGAMTPILPWLADKGIQVLNPLQWHLPGWDLHQLKKDYGQKICFHGGVDNQDVLIFRDEDDVRREVRSCVEALFSDKTGYILAPCHSIQAPTPIRNILAMYDEASKF